MRSTQQRLALSLVIGSLCVALVPTQTNAMSLDVFSHDQVRAGDADVRTDATSTMDTEDDSYSWTKGGWDANGTVEAKADAKIGYRWHENDAGSGAVKTDDKDHDRHEAFWRNGFTRGDVRVDASGETDAETDRNLMERAEARITAAFQRAVRMSASFAQRACRAMSTDDENIEDCVGDWGTRLKASVSAMIDVAFGL